VTENNLRYYKGMYLVEIVTRGIRNSRGKGPLNYRVKALEEIQLHIGYLEHAVIPAGNMFVTVPRMLWRHPKKQVGEKQN
jgi:hypothetical protein